MKLPHSSIQRYLLTPHLDLFASSAWKPGKHTVAVKRRARHGREAQLSAVCNLRELVPNSTLARKASCVFDILPTKRNSKSTAAERRRRALIPDANPRLI
jgi:hypothetical protein